MPEVARTDPVETQAKEIAGPPQSGIAYVHEKCLKEVMASGAANAFAFAIQNPEAVDCLITRVIVRLTTAGGTGSSVLDVDVGSSATATGDDIIDGLDLNTTGNFDSLKNPGTNGDEKPVTWDKKGGTNDYLTGKILAQNASSLAGEVYVYYIPTA